MLRYPAATYAESMMAIFAHRCPRSKCPTAVRIDRQRRHWSEGERDITMASRVAH
jgi:hypothetical protein